MIILLTTSQKAYKIRKFNILEHFSGIRLNSRSSTKPGHQKAVITIVRA